MKGFVLDGDSLARDRHVNLNGDLSDRIGITHSSLPPPCPQGPINSNGRLEFGCEGGHRVECMSSRLPVPPHQSSVAPYLEFGGSSALKDEDLSFNRMTRCLFETLCIR